LDWPLWRDTDLNLKL